MIRIWITYNGATAFDARNGNTHKRDITYTVFMCAVPGPAFKKHSIQVLVRHLTFQQAERFAKALQGRESSAPSLGR